MTIPTYLTALADLCDKHGTHAKGMGPELRLLAGLPWEECRKDLVQTGPVVIDVAWEEPVTPADVARGWLLSARVIADKNGALLIPSLRLTDESYVDRAAACAELAALSCATNSQMPGSKEIWENYPHRGTVEGARAAWGFIRLELVRREGPHQGDADRKMTRDLIETYRRELEAMK